MEWSEKIFPGEIFAGTPLRVKIKIYFFSNLFEDLMMFESLFAAFSQVMSSDGDSCWKGDKSLFYFEKKKSSFGNFKVKNFRTDDRYESKID